VEYTRIQGTDVPTLGLGTWQNTGDSCAEAVRVGLEAGYRHVDTAQVYENEEEVGKGIAAASVERSEIFLTTKVWRADDGGEEIRRSTEASLTDLGTDYVDLLLVHWPPRKTPLPEVMRTLQRLADEGKARHVGVSNFPPSWVTAAMDHAQVFCNQVEYHPYLGQGRLLNLAREHDFLLTGYSPLARGKVFDDPVLSEIAAAHNVGPAAVVIRRLMDQDHVAVVPKATSPEHVRSNLDALEISLSDEERARIDGLHRGERIIDPPWMADWED